MNISRAEIEVTVVVVVVIVMRVVMAIMVMMPVVIGMRVMLVMMVMMIVIIAQKPCACEIDAKAQNRDGYGFVIPDGDRVHEALDALIADEQRDHAEHNGACKTREVAELAGPEGEAVVVKVTPRIGVGQRRYRERGGMRRHVPAIRHKGERAEHRAANDFANHHDGSQADDRPNALGILVLTRAQEHVFVPE